MSREFQERYYPESRFGGFTNIDGTVIFYSRVRALLKPDDTVVDFGCGRGGCLEDPVAYRRELRTLKGRVREVIGLDVDERALSNPTVDEVLLLESDQWPLSDRSVDLVVCDQVLEHLPDPDRFFSESRRVLKPGGYLCIRTPNKWSYIGIASRIIPSRRHAKVLKAVQEGRREEDVFPTLYRCNSLPAVRGALARHGFEDSAVMGYEAEPSYLVFSRWAYRVGVIYNSIVPRMLRSSIFVFARVG